MRYRKHVMGDSSAFEFCACFKEVLSFQKKKLMESNNNLNRSCVIEYTNMNNLDTIKQHTKP